MRCRSDAAFTLGDGRQPDVRMLGDYSRMKYGDPKSTKILAKLLFENFVSKYRSPVDPLENDKIVIASSAYGFVPTAAFRLRVEFERLMNLAGVSFEVVKIERSLGVGSEDYAELNNDQRESFLAKRKLSLPCEAIEKLDGSRLIVIDDLFATGRHQEAILDLLKRKTPVKDVLFLYILRLSERLSRDYPMAEHSANRYSIRNLDDYFQLVQDGEGVPHINARVIKFLLMEGFFKPTKFIKLLQRLPLEFCQNILEAAQSEDMKKFSGRYFSVVEILENEIFKKIVAENETSLKN
jgi:adenine/guanine phosphoribosyltransferase-like PRPP-binding protein